MAMMGLPLLVRTARAGFEQVNARYERVAATLGASPARIFLTISLPLAWPSVLAGAVLAFARALGEFGATIIVAGSIPGATRTLAVAIYGYAETGQDAQALDAAARVGRDRVRGAVDGEPPGREARGVIDLDIELTQGTFVLAPGPARGARRRALRSVGRRQDDDPRRDRRPAHAAPRRDRRRRPRAVLVGRRHQSAAAPAPRRLRAAGRRALSAHARARQPALRPPSRRLAAETLRIASSGDAGDRRRCSIGASPICRAASASASRSAAR